MILDREKEILRRVWRKIGDVGYHIGQSYDYCAVVRVKDKGAKQNYSVKQWLSTAGDCVKHLKSLPEIKYVASHYGYIRFYFDDTSIQLAVDREIAEDIARRNAELDAINLTPYVPSKKVIEKLTGYFNKGSKVNVAAIKDEIKMLTYYCAGKQLGWHDLCSSISQETIYGWYWKDNDGNDISKIIRAMDRRVKVDETIAVSRSRVEERLLDFSKKIWQEVKKSGLDFNFRSVPTTREECWKDAVNGCAYTIAYELTVGKKVVHFSDVTNEGGGTFGYQFHPNGYLFGKGELENRIVAKLQEA